VSYDRDVILSRNSEEFFKKFLDPDRTRMTSNIQLFSLVHVYICDKIFRQIRSVFYYVKSLTDRQTDRQTDKLRALHNLIGRYTSFANSTKLDLEDKHTQIAWDTERRTISK